MITAVRNPLPMLARAVGTQRWLMRSSRTVVWLDDRLHRLFRGRVTLVGVAGLPSLRLTTTGRKTGEARSVNLLYCPVEDGFVLTASNWGRPRDPGWAHNLRACPHATVNVRGEEIACDARELKGDEYDRMWRRLLEFWPGYEMERDEAGRDLPVFVLNRS